MPTSVVDDDDDAVVDAVDAVLEVAAAPVVASVPATDPTAGGGPSAGGGAKPADWLCSAANRLCMKAVTASLDDVSPVEPLAVVDVPDVLDVLDDVPSNETPSAANALLIADAKRPMPPVDDGSAVLLLAEVANGSLLDDTPLRSEVVRFELLLIDVMDMGVAF